MASSGLFIMSGGGSGSSKWSDLTAAAADLTLNNAGFNTTFNQTSAVNWKWLNTTAASSGTSQSSPILNVGGQYWNGAASAADAWTLQNVIANGTNGASTLTFTHSGSTGQAQVNAPAFHATTNGTTTNCSISVAAGNNWGFNSNASGRMTRIANGSTQCEYYNGRTQYGSGHNLSFVSTSDPTGTTPDLGISRQAAGVLAIGNGTTVGDTTGNLQLNQITKYNGEATAGVGTAYLRGSTSQKAETGADTNVLTVTPAAAAGSYRLRVVLSLSAASSATIGWTATWTDSNGNAQTPTNLALFQTGVAAPALTFTTSAAGNYYGQCDIDVNNAGTNIVIKTTFAGTSVAYKITATIERIA